MKPYKNSIPLDTYYRVQLECMKVQAHSALEIPNAIWNAIKTRSLWRIKNYDIFHQLGNYRNVTQFQIISRKEIG